MPGKNNFQPPTVLKFVLGSLALWHSNTGLRERAIETRRASRGLTRAASGLTRAAAGLTRAAAWLTQATLEDKAGAVLWAALVEWGATASCCTSALWPERLFSTAARFDFEAARRRALELEAHVRQTQTHSNQVDQGSTQTHQ